MAGNKKQAERMLSVWVRECGIILGGFFLSIMIPYMAALLWSGQAAMQSRGLSYSGDMILAEGEEMDVENFLVLALVRQAEKDAPPEARQAQAVAERTNIYKAMEETHSNQAEVLEIEYGSLSQLKKQWGEDFAQIYQDCEEAVSVTAGEVLTFGGQLAAALYHKASAGNTRSMGEKYPWLVPVESSDQLCDGYLTVTDFGPERLAEAVNAVDGVRQVSVEEIRNSLQIVSRSDQMYVTAVQIGSQTFSGEEIASALQLNSTAFSFEISPERVRVTGVGIGHGWGMSQTGAARMARERKSRQEILSFYYPGTEITLRR